MVLLEKLKNLPFIEETLQALMNSDCIEVSEEDLPDEYATNPQKYVQDKVDSSFKWLGTQGGNHDGETIFERFELGGKCWEGTGYHSSWGDSEYPTSVEDYYEVEQYEKTVKCYKKV